MSHIDCICPDFAQSLPATASECVQRASCQSAPRSFNQWMVRSPLADTSRGRKKQPVSEARRDVSVCADTDLRTANFSHERRTMKTRKVKRRRGADQKREKRTVGRTIRSMYLIRNTDRISREGKSASHFPLPFLTSLNEKRHEVQNASAGSSILALLNTAVPAVPGRAGSSIWLVDLLYRTHF